MDLMGRLLALLGALVTPDHSAETAMLFRHAFGLINENRAS